MQESSLIGYRTRRHAGYALIEALAQFVAAGGRAIARGIEAFAASQRQARARSELSALSDHYLKDIGIERREIDRLFR